MLNPNSHPLETSAESTAEQSAEPAPIKPLPPGVRLLPDLEYVPNGHPRQRLDLYLPETVSQPLPVLLWIHGGGWVTGDKAGGPAIQFATKGFAVASMNYRFSRHATFPAQTHDCKAAVRWLRAHAQTYGLDTGNFGVWGASAGGHLASMLGLTAANDWLEGTLGNADQSSTVQAVVDWFGPTDFITLGPRDTRTQFLGGDALAYPDKANAASPIRYVSNHTCPFFIVHGDHDPLVPYEQSVTFAQSLQDVGAEVTFVTIPGGRHGGSKFARPDELARIEAFFHKHLRSTK